ncbi:MAG: HEAT repeat domain-containing protein [Pyrinomonadaceae bacterium]
MKILLLTVISLSLFVSTNGQIQDVLGQIAVEQLANKELERLKSADVETRRDAAHQLRLQENAVAARAASVALSDKSEIVRAVACEAIAYAADEDAARFLTPLLSSQEKSEYVRREAAFALGEAHSKTSVPALIQTLQTDKKPSVRAAAAVSLGKISDDRAIESLSQTLLLPNTKKNRRVVDEFVRRSAARALGEIRNRQAVPTLIAVLRDMTNADDVRREAAFALGIIADQSAAEILRENINAKDYLLAEIAKNALQRIQESGIESQKQNAN